MLDLESGYWEHWFLSCCSSGKGEKVVIESISEGSLKRMVHRDLPTQDLFLCLFPNLRPPLLLLLLPEEILKKWRRSLLQFLLDENLFLLSQLSLFQLLYPSCRSSHRLCLSGIIILQTLPRWIVLWYWSKSSRCILHFLYGVGFWIVNFN